MVLLLMDGSQANISRALLCDVAIFLEVIHNPLIV